VPMYQDAVAQEMVYVLQDASVRIVVAENQEQVDKMFEVREQVPTLAHVIYDDPRGLRHYSDPLLLSWEALQQLGDQYASGAPNAYMDAVNKVQPDDTAAMFYTSGTTGKPK